MFEFQTNNGKSAKNQCCKEPVFSSWRAQLVQGHGDAFRRTGYYLIVEGSVQDADL